ncbi:hypothetical protein [Aeromicrobium sp.]|uniref:hypothetical protein n=1 Tax=Aeromicrobium sp. TaxID=1871063 RepID=UPI0028A79BC3|nr:hypothetical protein [Aeromicrobium sp.]
MRLLRPILLGLLALLLVPLAATPAQAAAEGTITGVAVGPDGKPLKNVRWEILELQDGKWQGYPFGPKLTDAKGRFSWKVPVGGQYRVCFFDDYYGQDSQDTYWQTEVRHRDTCWPNATSVQNATTWTSTSSAPSKTFSVKLPKQALGMAPVDPFLLGSFRVNEPLTVVGQEGWRPTNATFSYRWMSQRDGVAAVPIAGATSATYTPTSAQSGAWVWAEVTASRAGYKPATLTTPVSKVGGTHVQPSSPLKVTGSAKPGATLTASFGKPANTFSTLTWLVDGVPQPRSTTWGQASSSFTVAASHAGARIDARLQLYRTDAAGNYVDGSDSFHRVQVQVAGSRPAKPLAKRPTVAGKPTVGRILAAPRTVTADPTATVRYQWLRGSTTIKGATKSRYKVRAVDVNKRLKVRVTVARPGWVNQYVSTSTATIAKRPLKVGTVKIAGTSKVGKKLTAKTARWGPRPVKVRFQWLRNGRVIKGATKATYKVRKADRHKVIKVRVVAKKPKYLTVVKTSKGRKVRR